MEFDIYVGSPQSGKTKKLIELLEANSSSDENAVVIGLEMIDDFESLVPSYKNLVLHPGIILSFDGMFETISTHFHHEPMVVYIDNLLPQILNRVVKVLSMFRGVKKVVITTFPNLEFKEIDNACGELANVLTDSSKGRAKVTVTDLDKGGV